MGATDVIASEKQTQKKKHCPTCGQEGADVDVAQQRIKELEFQVQFLTDRASRTGKKKESRNRWTVVMDGCELLASHERKEKSL